MKDLEEYLSSDEAEEQDFYWGELNDGWEKYETPWGTMEWVDTDSYYDEVNHLKLVFKIGDRFFRKYGYYDSWSGGAWDGDLEEVRPREKMITVYEAI